MIMRKFITFTILSILLSSATFSQQDILGVWSGELESSIGKIQITLSITTSPLSGKISTSSGIEGMKIKNLTFDGQQLSFNIPSFKVAYDGILEDDIIKGIWQQGKHEATLDFVRQKQKTKTILRGQTPTAIEGYKVEEVIFNQMKDNTSLSGTLTMPIGEGPFPAVILLSVAGANDRDQTHSLGHKPFLVIADFLSRNGIAVLRYDDRGVGESAGNLFECDFSTLTGDALSAFNYLCNIKEIDSTKIGFIGNSEGSVIGGMSAIKNPNVAFTIMLGAVGVPLSELFVERLDKMQAIYSFSDLEKKELLSYSDELDKIIAKDISIEQKQTEIENLKADNTLDKSGFPNYLFFLPVDKQDRIDLYLTPWYKAQSTYDPQKVLQYLACPTLVINGSLDFYQSPELNLPSIQKALLKAGNKDFCIMVAPNINHVMQDARTGLPTEYAKIENTVSPIILQTLSDWINTRFNLDSK